MSWFGNFFSFFKDKSETSEPTKQEKRDPVSVDYRDSLQCNQALTKGLYHNSYPGMKLAGSMAFNPIAVPVWFMGLPVPVPVDDTDEDMKAAIEKITEQFSTQISGINIQTHRDGTIWIWPFYSASAEKVIWEEISDETVTDIVRNIITGELIEIHTSEQMTVTSGYGKQATATRKRTFTKKKVEITWSGATGDIPGDIRNAVYRNPIGVLPIPFTNNKDGKEVRGHSDYERIVSDLKDYHDIDLKQSEVLAKFNIKMVQGVKNPEAWKTNNGITSLAELSPANLDFVMNMPEETTEFKYPVGAYDAAEKVLQRKFKKIVEGSGIPEMLWGVKIEGNHATAEEQMGMLVKFIGDKQSQKTEAYEKLFQATLYLYGLAEMTNVPEIKVKCNAMDAISEKVKSEIFASFSQGISALINSAGVTKDFIFKLYKRMYPDLTDGDLDEFKKGLAETAKHKAFQNQPYDVLADMNGEERLDDEEEIEIPTVPEPNRDQNLHIVVNQAPLPAMPIQPAQKNDIVVNVPEIKLPVQPVTIELNTASGKDKTVTVKRDKDGNIESYAVKEN
jgi:hypothetical protein